MKETETEIEEITVQQADCFKEILGQEWELGREYRGDLRGQINNRIDR